MEESIKLVLVGGAISLVSTMTGIALQKWFDLLKQKRETRQYPTQILFNKQTEFYDKLAKLLPDINGYITTIDVWLGETSADAAKKVQHYAEENKPLWQLHELIEQYFMYLPKQIVEAANELFAECTFLSNKPTMEKTERCLDRLFSFQNVIRTCAGQRILPGRASDQGKDGEHFQAGRAPQGPPELGRQLGRSEIEHSAGGSGQRFLIDAVFFIQPAAHPFHFSPDPDVGLHC